MFTENKMTIITRAETIHVEQNWRQGTGGRVLTFDMMLEMPHSPKVAGLGLNSEVAFEGRRYIVNHKEVVREESPRTVRLVLTGASRTVEARPARSKRPASLAPFFEETATRVPSR